MDGPALVVSTRSYTVKNFIDGTGSAVALLSIGVIVLRFYIKYKSRKRRQAEGGKKKHALGELNDAIH